MTSSALAENSESDNDEDAPATNKRGGHSSLFHQLKRQSKKSPKCTHEQAVKALTDHLDNISSLYCKTTRGRTKKCTCLSILKDTQNRDAVVAYLSDWEGQSKLDRDQSLLTAHIYAKNTESVLEKAMGKKVPNGLAFFYKIPFTSFEGDDISELRDHNICESAFCNLHNIGRKRWDTIRVTAETSSTARPHSNVGNTNAAVPIAKKEVLVNHFTELQNMASKEPRATRFIRNIVDGVSSQARGDGDTLNDLYLPASKGYWPCYYRYCNELGYTVRN